MENEKVGWKKYQEIGMTVVAVVAVAVAAATVVAAKMVLKEAVRKVSLVVDVETVGTVSLVLESTEANVDSMSSALTFKKKLVELTFKLVLFLKKNGDSSIFLRIVYKPT